LYRLGVITASIGPDADVTADEMDSMHTIVAESGVEDDRRWPGAPATVAICAYTMARWSDIQAAVGSIVDQLRSTDECLLVIDHNQDLLSLAAATYASHGQVRVIASTGTRGLSGARNTAVAEGRGEIIAFLDDDAVAGTDWLPTVAAALAEPDVWGVGTAALPAWPNVTRPSWFPPEFDWVVGCSYRGLPTETTHVRNVIGAAMAFRRDVFELAGTFSSDVGRVGLATTGCEETELCIRLRQRRPSAIVTYLPHVAVSHRVTPERVLRRYFLRRCLGEGRSKARVAKLVGSDDALLSERAYVRSVLPRAVLRELRRGLRGDVAGFAAAAFIVIGVGVAGVGYVHTALGANG
jgi:glycosyltransferase involved in cell wall biosynthesis